MDKRGDELPEELAFRGQRKGGARTAPSRTGWWRNFAGWPLAPWRRRISAEPSFCLGSTSASGCLLTRRSRPTDPVILASCPAREGVTVQQSYNCRGGGQWPTGDRGGPGHQPTLGQAAWRWSMVEEAIGNAGDSPQGGFPRRRRTTRPRRWIELYDLGVTRSSRPGPDGWVPPPAPRGRRTQGTVGPGTGCAASCVRSRSTGTSVEPVVAGWSGFGSRSSVSAGASDAMNAAES